MADEVLGAVDHPVAAVAPGRGLHRAHVRAGLGLGHGEAVDPLAARGRQQIALALLRVAAAQDVGRPAPEHRQRVGRAAQLPLEQREGQMVEPAAAELLGNVRRVEAQLLHLARDLAPDLGRHLARSARPRPRAGTAPARRSCGRSRRPSPARGQAEVHALRSPTCRPTSAGFGRPACAAAIRSRRPVHLALGRGRPGPPWCRHAAASARRSRPPPRPPRGSRSGRCASASRRRPASGSSPRPGRRHAPRPCA